MALLREGVTTILSKKVNLVFVFLVFSVIFLFQLRSCDRELSRTKRMYEAANDSLRISRNDFGQEVAKRLVIEAESESDLLDLHTKDSLIISLQDQVRKYKGRFISSIATSHTTTVSGAHATDVVIQEDTLNFDSLSPDMIYVTSWDQEWDMGYVIATTDSIFHDIKVKNKFVFTFSEERNGWFRPKESTLTVTNLNPKTATDDVHSFLVQSVPKRIGLGVFGGVDLHTLKPSLGVGITYNLLMIK